MNNSFIPFHNPRILIALATAFLCTLNFPNPSHSFQPVSLKTYPTRALVVTSPIDLTKLSRKDTYQINDPNFILQFFFSGPKILGIILKRDPRFPVKMRWCFFRDCEESPYDYNVVIAEASNPPFVENFFEVKLPPGLQYNFQGLYFSSRKKSGSGPN